MLPRNIIEAFDISPVQSRVAIIEYSTSPRLAVALDNYGSKTRLMCAVDTLQYNGKYQLSTVQVIFYHLQKLSGKSGCKVNETPRFGPFQRNISIYKGKSEKVR